MTTLTTNNRLPHKMTNDHTNDNEGDQSSRLGRGGAPAARAARRPSVQGRAGAGLAHYRLGAGRGGGGAGVQGCRGGARPGEVQGGAEVEDPA